MSKYRTFLKDTESKYGQRDSEMFNVFFNENE